MSMSGQDGGGNRDRVHRGGRRGTQRTHSFLCVPAASSAV